MDNNTHSQKRRNFINEKEATQRTVSDQRMIVKHEEMHQMTDLPTHWP